MSCCLSPCHVIDGEGDKQGKEITGVSRPYSMNLGKRYA